MDLKQRRQARAKTLPEDKAGEATEKDEDGGDHRGSDIGRVP